MMCWYVFLWTLHSKTKMLCSLSHLVFIQKSESIYFCTYFFTDGLKGFCFFIPSSWFSADALLNEWFCITSYCGKWSKRWIEWTLYHFKKSFFWLSALKIYLSQNLGCVINYKDNNIIFLYAIFCSKLTTNSKWLGKIVKYAKHFPELYFEKKKTVFIIFEVDCELYSCVVGGIYLLLEDELQ